jgi:DNA-binding MarR family transcriptional regulator
MLPEQEYLGLLIGAARRSIKLAVQRHVSALRLTAPQFWFLNAAREHPGASLSEIARRQRIDPPTASRVAESLGRRGLLRIAPDDRDRRAVRILLTPSGMRVAGRIGPIASSVRAAVVRGMSRREQALLRDALRRVVENLDAFAAEAGRARGGKEAAAARNHA